MASHQPPRAASIADRRASATARQQRTRPASAAQPSPTPGETRSDSKPSFQTRKQSTTTTETTRKDTLTREFLIKRTLSPTKKPADPNGRRSVDVEGPPSKEKQPVRREQSESVGMFPGIYIISSLYTTDRTQQHHGVLTPVC